MKETYHLTSGSIKAWAEDDRPREKLLSKGRSALSNAELIAILIGSGTKKQSAVDLSKDILASVGNNLHELGKKTIADLMKFNGIGEAKAISIAAAAELGRRRANETPLDKFKISCSQDAFKVLNPHLSDLPHEAFYVILLNRANKVLDVQLISRGGVSGTVADTKLIFQSALLRLASGMILAHNHPSGNLKPSEADKNLTRKIVDAGKTLDIAVLDHIIVGDNAYFSFADEGMM